MTDSGRRAILKRAAGQAELVAEVPPVVAAGFGVLALRRRGEVLTVACFPHANRRALRLLRDVLGTEIVASPFDERMLHEAIREAYFADREESVNLPTFLREDFLEDPRAAAALVAEKVEQVPAPTPELPAEQVLLGELTYRSQVRNLDRAPVQAGLPDPARTRLLLGELDLAWRRVEGVPRPCLPVDPRACLLLNEYRFVDYQRGHGVLRASEHQVRACQVLELPHVIHATEVQVVGLEADGALLVHAYDRVQRVRAPQRLELCYYFLSYGNRVQRTITVDVHELQAVPRVDCAVVAPGEWGAHELGRWLDVSAGGSMGEDSGGVGSNHG